MAEINDSPPALKLVEDALKAVQDEIKVSRVVDYAVIVDTGRQFSDGAPLSVRVWVPPNQDALVAVGDGGVTYARLGENASNAPDYALSVRHEMLEYLPVREIRGQVVTLAKKSQLAEAIGILSDACLALDVAVIVANHLRPHI